MSSESSYDLFNLPLFGQHLFKTDAVAVWKDKGFSLERPCCVQIIQGDVSPLRAARANHIRIQVTLLGGKTGTLNGLNKDEEPTTQLQRKVEEYWSTFGNPLLASFRGKTPFLWGLQLSVCSEAALNAIFRFDQIIIIMSHSVHYGGKQGSDYGLIVEKLFGFRRGNDGTSLATRIVTPFLCPYSNLWAKWNAPYSQVMQNHLFDKVKNRF